MSRQDKGAASGTGSRKPSPSVLALSGFDPSRIHRSLYSPTKGVIACVLLQAAFRGDREPCHFFGAGDWETGFPDSSFAWFELPREEWRALGLMTREERIAFYASQHASAIEARRAATGTGAVHESAAAKPDAQSEVSNV